MKKVILDLNTIDPKDFDREKGNEAVKKELHEYIAAEMGFEKGHADTLTSLYDELAWIDEPVAIGLFMPAGELDELDIDYMMYLDEIKEVFNDAENDNENIAVIHGDIVENGGVDAGEDVDAILEELLRS